MTMINKLIKLLCSQWMPESKLQATFIALIISRILYALPAWGGFLNSQQIYRINAFLRKAQRFGFCSSMCVCMCVMFLNISQLLTANYLITHKVLPTASPIYFHQKCTILVCVLEDIVMPFPYAQTTFVNAALFLVVFSVFCDQCLCIVSPIVQHLRLSFVY